MKTPHSSRPSGLARASMLLLVACALASPGVACGRSEGSPARPAVIVRLEDFRMVPDRATLPGGATRFVATNASRSEVHELAVLRAKADGSYENLGEIEDLAPGASGEIVLNLRKGTYVLACLIAPGEAGSTVDHFKMGMRIDVDVS